MSKKKKPWHETNKFENLKKKTKEADKPSSTEQDSANEDPKSTLKTLPYVSVGENYPAVYTYTTKDNGGGWFYAGQIPYADNVTYTTMSDPYEHTITSNTTFNWGIEGTQADIQFEDLGLHPPFEVEQKKEQDSENSTAFDRNDIVLMASGLESMIDAYQSLIDSGDPNLSDHLDKQIEHANDVLDKLDKLLAENHGTN